MFGFFKKLVAKPEPEPEQVMPPAARPQPASPTPPASNPPAARPSIPVAAPPAARVAAAETPLAVETVTATPGPSANSGVAVAEAEPGETVELPYKTLFTKLAPAVQELASRQPKSGEALRLPVARIRAQLASGGVKVSLAELRQFSPPGIFVANGHDETLAVDLPLSEVLPRLKPDHLGRRTDQRKIEITEDIGPIFGPGGGPVKVSSEPARPAPAAPKSSAATIAEFKARLAAQAKAAAPAEAPIPGPAPAPAEPVRPAAAPAAAAPAVPASSAPAISMAPISPIAPSAAPVAPAAAAVEEKPIAIKAPGLDPALAGQKKAAKQYLTLSMADLETHWTAAGKTQLAGLCRHTVEIPMEIVELGLKRGKLVFPFSQIKGWIRMTAGAEVPDLPGEEEIELPLAVVAPRFLEQHKPLRRQRQITISEEIPDVFAPKQAEAAPTAVEPEPAPAPEAVAPSSAGTPAPINEFGKIFGKPEKGNWSLQEIVQHCAQLAGVTGALLATPDGLLIASAWPGEVKSETVAAFLPQIHGRVTQFSNQLKLGEPDHFTLVLGELPLGIYKTNSSYFIVLGRAGENLPKPQLAAVAHRLTQQTTR